MVQYSPLRFWLGEESSVDIRVNEKCYTKQRGVQFWNAEKHPHACRAWAIAAKLGQGNGFYFEKHWSPLLPEFALKTLD